MILAGLVSVIIPVHNRPAMLREAVASVLGQTYRPIEVVIVDDGSTDETPEVADQLAAANPSEFRVIHQENRGPGPAREAGRQSARGAFIQYLDSDDLLRPTKLAAQVQALRDCPDCGVAYGKTRYYGITEEPRDESLKRTGEQIDRMFPAFLASRWWSTSTPLYRRSLTDAAGCWANLVNEEDWEYDCRIASMGVKLAFVDEFVSDTRDHSADRLNRDGAVDRKKLSDRAKARRLIYQHALRAGISCSAPEMKIFSRYAFLLARQCGVAGLDAESRDLVELAIEAGGSIL